MSALPAAVKVGFLVYRIESWCPMDAKGAGRYGEVNLTSRIIRVDESHGSVQTAETLLHEILHSAWNVWRVDDTDLEERTISMLSHALTTIWVDNPGLLAWFSDAIAGRGPA